MERLKRFSIVALFALFGGVLPSAHVTQAAPFSLIADSSGVVHSNNALVDGLPTLQVPNPSWPGAPSFQFPNRRASGAHDPLLQLPTYVRQADNLTNSAVSSAGVLPTSINTKDTNQTIAPAPIVTSALARVPSVGSSLILPQSFRIFLPLISMEGQQPSPPTTGGLITPDSGGVITVPDQGITVGFAPGAVSVPAIGQVVAITPRTLPLSLRPVGIAFDLSVASQADSVPITLFHTQVTTATVLNSEFQAWQTTYMVTPTVTIHVSYAAADLSSIAERTLSLYRQNQTTGGWVAMPSSVDAQQHVIRATVEQSGRYIVFGYPVLPLLVQASGLSATQIANPSQTLVILDPDHGGSDPGGTVTSPSAFAALEKTYNLQIAQMVRDRLQACGVQVQMTREDDSSVSFPMRASIINSRNPAAAATLAFNVVNSFMSLANTGSGPEAWVNLAKANDVAFGAQINSQVSSFTGLPNTRGVKNAAANPGGPIYVALNVTSRFTHSELAFMDNFTDRAFMNDPAGRGKIADGVFIAFVDTLGGQSICTTPGFQFPAPLSAAERARLRNLGYQNYMRYRGDPVNTSTGDQLQLFTDISTPGVSGLKFVFQRTYNSLDTRDGRFGFGWSSLLDMNLRLANDGSVDVHYPDGHGVYFTGQGADFVSGQQGVFDRLTRNGADLLLTTPDQMFYQFAIQGAYGRLVKISDRHGNAILIERDGTGRETRITDSAGRLFTLSYSGEHVVALSDEAGRQLQYSYDANGDLVSTTNANGGIHHFNYANHHLMALTDPQGILYLQNSYDDQGRVIDQIDASGTHNTFSYSNASQTPFVDNLGQQTVDSFDSLARVTDVHDANGNHEQFVYDAADHVTSYTDKRGNTWKSTYDERGNLLSVTDPLGHTISYTYNATNDLLSVTDLGGPGGTARTTSFVYDGEGNLLRIVQPDGSAIRAVYDSHGQPVLLTNANNHTTSYGYDTQGNLTSVTDPLSHTMSYTYDGIGRRTSSTDANGNTAHVVYDRNSNIIQRVDPNGQPTTLTYDSNDNLIKMIDRVGGITTYQYDENLKLVAQTDPEGHTTRYRYDKLYRCIQTIDATGNITSYRYDALGQLRAIEDTLQGVTHIGYDAQGNVISVTDALGHTTTFEYDALNRQVKQIDALNGATSYAYDAVSRLTNSTNPRGATTSFAYDLLNRRTHIHDALDGDWDTTYDAVGHAIRFTDANQHSTTWQYDAAERVVAITDPSGATTQFAYDAVGHTITTVDPLGHSTHATYDANGNLMQITDALLGVTTYEYTPNDQRSAVKDANGHVTRYQYDRDGLPIMLTEAGGQMSHLVYDSNHRLVRMTNANGNSWDFAYDALNRQVQMSDPLQHMTNYHYDAIGNLTDTTDANGITTHRAYDALSRLSTVIQHAQSNASPDAQTNVTTQYGYDALGNVTQIADANGHTTTFGYDLLNRLTNETNPLGKVWQYGYDPTSNLTQRVDANGTITRYSYDPRDLLTKISYPDGNNVNFAYDAVGNQVTMTDHLGTQTNVYDALNRQITTTNYRGEQIGVAYDAVGNRARLTFPNGSHLDYQYDANNQAIAMSDPTGESFQFGYDLTHNLTAITAPNGTHASMSYNAANQLVSLQNTKWSQVIASFVYQLDAVGNRTQVTETLNRAGAGEDTSSLHSANQQSNPNTTSQRTTYGYDALYRLVTVQGQTPGHDDALGLRVQYAYDSVGNRLTQRQTRADHHGTNVDGNAQPNATDTGIDSTKTEEPEHGNNTINSTYNAANQILTADNHHYTYDANGNRVREEASGLDVAYHYDSENRLIHVQRCVKEAAEKGDDAGQTMAATQLYDGHQTQTTCTITENSYDGYGRRVEQRIWTQQGPHDDHDDTDKWHADHPEAILTLSLFDGLDVIGEQDATATEHDQQSDHTVQQHQNQIYYYRGVGLILESEQFGKNGHDDQDYSRNHSDDGNHQTRTFFHYDGLGSVVVLTNRQGALIDRNRTDEFGIPQGEDASFSGAFSYTGQRYDRTTGLYHFYARDYDPATGTWLQQDPYRGQLDAPGTLHRYGYVGENPVMWDDPLGYAIEDALIGIQVHQYLQSIYQVSHPGAITENAICAGLNDTELANANVAIANLHIGVSCKSRPDIRDPGTGEIYEIKPISYQNNSAGRNQLQKYIDALNTLNGNDRYKKGTAWNPNGQSFSVFYTGGTADITLESRNASDPGMIYYRVVKHPNSSSPNYNVKPNYNPEQTKLPIPIPVPIPVATPGQQNSPMPNNNSKPNIQMPNIQMPNIQMPDNKTILRTTEVVGIGALAVVVIVVLLPIGL